MSAMRRAVKQGLELALEGSGVAAIARRRMRGRDLVLAYHNVVPDADVRADASAHLGVSNFAAQMRALAALADVVPVAALGTSATVGARPRVAITFDDGYVGALRHAVPVLTSLGLSATFFVCPSLMGGAPFWWDCPTLDVWSRAGELLTRLQGRGERVWERLRSEGLDTAVLGPEARPADLAMVRQAAAAPGISIGSHTMRHPNLAALTEAEVREELVASRTWLLERIPASVPWIAYPFGLANAGVERLAEETGYAGAFVLDGGWIPAAGARRFALPRLNVAAGLTVRGFRLRLGDIFAR